jgi:phosphate transport system substrate-binding protein
MQQFDFSLLPKKNDKTRKRLFLKKIIVVAVIVLLCVHCAPISRKPVTTLTLKGSDTMLPLVRFWSEVYMIENPGISVYVEGGGTATGMTALAQGKIDICMASRTIWSEEAQQLAAAFGTIGVSTRVAKDALSIYVNPENPVMDLTLEQIGNIYLGTIQNWSDVGGEKAPIRLLNRLPTSGTYAYFQEHVLNGKPYSASCQSLPTTKAIVETVAKDKYAIGYGGFAYETDIYHCAVNGVEPSKENVLNDTYPLIRYLYLYTVNTPEGVTKDFINWVLSEHGQDIVKWVGYFPIWRTE